MNIIITILLVCSVAFNVYLALTLTRYLRNNRAVKVENAQRSLVRGLRAQIDVLTTENTKLGNICIQQAETIKALRTEVIRLSKAAGFAGRVSETATKVASALKQVTLRNIGTAVGNIAGQTVVEANEVVRTVKDSAANVKGAYSEKTKAYAKPRKVAEPTFSEQVEKAIEESAPDARSGF